MGWAHGRPRLCSTHPPRNFGKRLNCTVSYVELSLPVTCQTFSDASVTGYVIPAKTWKGHQIPKLLFLFSAKREIAKLVPKCSPLVKGEPGFWPALSWGPSLSSGLLLRVLRCLETKWSCMWYLYKRQRALNAMAGYHFSLDRETGPLFKMLLFNHTRKIVKCLDSSEKGSITSLSLFSSHCKISEETCSWVSVSAHPVYSCACEWSVAVPVSW